MNAIDDVATRLDQLARATGFEEVDAATLGTTKTLPTPVRVWASRYAVIVAAATTADRAIAQSQSLQSWLDEVLLSRERDVKGVVDGYLVLVSPVELPANTVQQLRLDRRVCRKYVVWPESTGDRWARLDAVTVLGLPDRTGNSEEAAFQSPPEALSLLWRTLIDSDSDAEAIRQVCELNP